MKSGSKFAAQPGLSVRRLLKAALALALSVHVLACDTTGPKDPPSFTGTWGGQPWQGIASAVLVGAGQDSLYLFGASFGNTVAGSMHLTVRVAYTGPGTYVVNSGDADVVYLVGGDVLTSRYGIADGNTGQLVIQEQTARGVRGLVDLPMIHRSGEAVLGQSASFTGAFSATFLRAM